MADPVVQSDLFDLRGRVACVTGASGGLGRRAATVLAKAGASVVGIARRPDQLKSWQQEAGENSHAIAHDLSDRNSLAVWPDQSQNHSGHRISSSTLPESIHGNRPTKSRLKVGTLRWRSIWQHRFSSVRRLYRPWSKRVGAGSSTLLPCKARAPFRMGCHTEHQKAALPR